MTPKQKWKAKYRLQRIYIREHVKAMTDMLVYGTSAIHVSLDHEAGVKHVPIDELRRYNKRDKMWDDMKIFIQEKSDGRLI